MRTPELPSRSTTRIRSRWVRALVLLGLIAVAGCALLAAHRPLMRGAGWMLVRSDATERADVIVVAADADGAGVLEAADLVHEGFATRVALFVNQLDRASQEFQSRGVLYTDEAARSVSALRALGVKSVETIAPAVSGTGEEARVLPGWCGRMGYRTVLFVSTTDHSRRTHRELSRAARGSSVRIMVRYSRYSGFEPDRWWQTRGGVRVELVESQKLLLDFLLHPFS